LGVQAVLVKSFARIHRSNLINAGILPLTFANEADYERIAQGDSLKIENLVEAVKNGSDILLKNETNGAEIVCKCELSERAKAIVLAGGLLSYTKENLK
jgi:aconitate hydratase